jgi:hypothetical protein
VYFDDFYHFIGFRTGQSDFHPFPTTGGVLLLILTVAAHLLDWLFVIESIQDIDASSLYVGISGKKEFFCDEKTVL